MKFKAAFLALILPLVLLAQSTRTPVYDFTQRVLQPTNLVFFHQILSNNWYKGGNFSNITANGSFTYGLSDEGNLTFGNDYSMSLNVGLTETTAKGTLRTVDSVADLIAADPDTVDIFSGVNVLGYYDAGDGGGGFFRKILYATVSGTGGEGGIWFQSTADATWAWQRVMDQPQSSSRWFGIVGNGVDDDTPQWDTMMEWLNSTNGAGATVLVPPGDYRISHALAFSNSVSIIGAGKTNTFFTMTAPHGVTAPASTFDTNGGTNSVVWHFTGSNGVLLEGFTRRNEHYPVWTNFLAFRLATYAARAYSVRFRNCDNVTVNDVAIENAYSIGWKIEGSSDVVFNNCDSSVSIKDGFNADVSVSPDAASQRVRFNNCHVTGSGDVGFGFNSEPGSTMGVPQSNDLIADGCSVSDPIDWSGAPAATQNTAVGFNVSGARNVQVLNSYFEGSVRGTFFQILESPSSALHSMSNIVVSGNTFIANDPVAEGLALLQEAVNVQVIGNTFVDGTGSIRASNITNLVVRNNQFTGCLPTAFGPSDGAIVEDDEYRVSGGVIEYNSVSIDGTSGTVASREFLGVAGVTNYTVTSGTPIVYRRTQALYVNLTGAANVQFDGNRVDSWPIMVISFQNGSGLFSADGNFVENTQTLGDSTYGAVHSAAGSFLLSGKNILRNLGALSPGYYTQTGSGPVMRMAVTAGEYQPNATQIRVLGTAAYATNTTTLAELTGLAITLRPYRTYLVRAGINFTPGDSSMGIKIGWTTPAGTTTAVRQEFIYNGASSSLNDARAYVDWSTATSAFVQSASQSPYYLTGTIRTEPNGGTFVPTFAQYSATTNILTIHTGSFIEVTELPIE